MDDASQAIAVIVAIAIVAFFIWIGAYIAEQRRKLLREWAKAHDLTFYASRDRGIRHKYPRFGCLHQGSSRYAYNHITGDWKGLPFHGFDYHYEESDGEDTTTYEFSAVIIESPLPLKYLVLRKEGFGDRVAEFFGADDIDFESIEFSKEYFVKSDDKRWAYDVLHQRTMEFIMHSPYFQLIFDNQHIIAFRTSNFDTHDFEEAADLIHGILERIPGYMRESERPEPPKRGRLRL